MKYVKSLIWGTAAVLLVSAGAGNAWADRGRIRGHSSFGVLVGPGWGPWFYPPSFYYPPSPPIIIERSPPVYIEQPPRPAEPTSYWYYCNASNAYYPYVRECPSGWQRVLPRPQDQP